uniref:Uncharacterized protein n=1 Tax=Anguilla anguilla TaxID=7936 RepID=A0A0E9X7A0_ANGAN
MSILSRQSKLSLFQMNKRNKNTFWHAQLVENSIKGYSILTPVGLSFFLLAKMHKQCNFKGFASEKKTVTIVCVCQAKVRSYPVLPSHFLVTVFIILDVVIPLPLQEANCINLTFN